MQNLIAYLFFAFAFGVFTAMWWARFYMSGFAKPMAAPIRHKVEFEPDKSRAVNLDYGNTSAQLYMDDEYQRVVLLLIQRGIPNHVRVDNIDRIRDLQGMLGEAIQWYDAKKEVWALRPKA